LNIHHGADYFRRWHAYKDKSGTLLVHKSTHHFDLINWFLDSDPDEVFAHGSLDFYGKNNSFRAEKCRTCTHKCDYRFDITKNETFMNLYVANENIDGYIRDACVWRNDIDIYDKMAVQIKYANNVNLSYSLTTYSPYEGWRIAINGTQGRIDAWEGIPWEEQEDVNQAELHVKEMDQSTKVEKYDSIMISLNNGTSELIKVPRANGGHGGGDKRMLEKMFAKPLSDDPLRHSAGSRDGSFSILCGIAARKSIEEKRMVKIASITSLVPSAKRPIV